MRTRATIRPHFGHLISSPFRDFASASAIHCAPEYAPRARSAKGYITHRHSRRPCLPLRSNASERLFAGVRRGNYRRDKVDRILLCECDHRANEPIGLKADNSSKFTTDIDCVSGREGQK